MSVFIAKYSSVNAKVRALYGKLLSNCDYEELLEKRSVPSVAEYLKKSSGYGELLSSINESQVHRGELEKVFRASLYNDFIKVLRFLSSGSKKFLEAAFLRYEVEDLKMLFRIIYTGHKDETMKNSLVFLKNHSSLDFSKLINSSNIPDIVHSLKGSEYYKVLSPLASGSAKPNLFDIEMSLDLHYFMTMLKLTEKLLSAGDYKRIINTFGTEIDMLNIMVIYRCKKMFKLPSELTYKYVIPYWYRLSKEQLIQLSQSHNVDEFKKIISDTKYKNVFKTDEEHRWEINCANYLYRIYKNHFRTDNFSFGMTLAYLHLKEMDIRNIITLIEGVRYGLTKEEIKSYLIGINV